jgi:hypothetical protein
MIEGPRTLEFDALAHTVAWARDHDGRIWQGDDGRVVWFHSTVPLSVAVTHPLCRGGGFIGTWTESIAHRLQQMALH